MDIVNNLSKENVYLSLVNHESYKDKLVDRPTRRFLDLNVVYSFWRPDSSNEDKWLDNSDMEYLGLKEEDLFEIALGNTMDAYPPKFARLEDIIKDMLSISDDPLYDIEFSEDCKVPLYFFGNSSCINGSAVIMYHDILKRLSELFEEGFYILPSSIHEYLIITESGIDSNEEYLLSMVKSVNRSVLTPDQVLSDSVYHYCFKSNIISVISSINLDANA